MTKIYIKRTPKESAEKIAEAIKHVKKNMAYIRKFSMEQGASIQMITSVDIEYLTVNEAYDRGQYVALQEILSFLKK